MDVSLITINYNSSQDTLELLDSLKSHLPKELKLEILVVDNASDNHNFNKLKNYVDQNSQNFKVPIRLLESQINVGFGAGNMLGAYAAKGKYLLFINNDCLIDQDIVTPLKEFMENHQDIAMIGGQMVDENGQSVISHGTLPTLLEKLLGKKISEYFNHKRGRREVLLNGARQVDMVSGSLMFVRADTFFKLGGFDPNFFLYSEEEDFGKRAQKNGLKIFSLPWVKYSHKVGGSTGGMANHLTKEFYISFLMYFRKHHGALYELLIRLIYFLKVAKKDFSLALFILKGAPTSSSLRSLQKRVTR